MDKRVRESISLYRCGDALAAKCEGGHITGDYSILKDETVDGTRTIVLEEKDKTEFIRKVKAVAKATAVKIGEGKSKVLIKLLEDTLIDYEDESLDRLYKKIVLGDESVKASEGCFKIIIGDGRRKSADIISLRS